MGGGAVSAPQAAIDSGLGTSKPEHNHNQGGKIESEIKRTVMSDAEGQFVALNPEESPISDLGEENGDK